MPKTIIPELVTFQTNLKALRGSYFIRDLDFFPDSPKPAKYHYRLELSSNISYPEKYEFRNGYYRYSDGRWYYYRQLFGFIKLKFCYDPTTRTFTFNKMHSLIPLEIGGILPVGKLISDLVGLELLLDGFIIMRGFAFSLKDRTYCAIAPSFNGKTTLMTDVLKTGGGYLAEDILVLKDGRVFPTAAISKNYGRHINAKLEKDAKKHQYLEPKKFNELVMFYNSTNKTKPISADHSDYYFLNSLTMTDNKFLRSYIFVHGLTAKFRDATFMNQKWLEQAGSRHIQDFNYEKLFKDAPTINQAHWNDLGADYSNVWQSLGKQWLSQKELSFITQHATGAKAVLDVGIGNGRIIQAHLGANPNATIYGLDVAQSMVDVCTKRFHADPRVQQLEVADLSTEDVPFTEQFDIITCIRVLKYNANWEKIITKLCQSLRPGGQLIFTMANDASLNRFSRYPIPTYKTTPNEIQRLTAANQLTLKEIASFTRIPDKFYDVSNSQLYARIIIGLEIIFAKLLHHGLLGRELFIIVKK